MSWIFVRKQNVAWTPSDVPGLLAWYDASDSNTLFDATTAGSSVTSNGAAVRRWEDKHGSYDATEATDAPVLDTGSSGSLDFDGTNDRLNISTSFGSRSELTIVAFVRREGTGSYPAVLMSRTQASESGMIFDINGTELRLMWRNDHYLTTTGLTVPLNDWSMCAVRYQSTSAKASLGTGSVISHFTTTATLASATIDSAKIGINDVPNSPRCFPGKIGELLVYDNFIADSDLSDIFTNLGSRFGLG